MDARTRILDAALGLVAAGDARQLTQPRIARAAGIRQSHLTYYFPTVADLLQAVARHMVERLVADVRQRPPAARPAALVGSLARAAADPRRVRVMLALVAAADGEPALKPRLRRLVRELRAGIADVLASAGIDADAADVALMHSVVVGAAVLHFARANATARREMRAVLARALAALGTKE